MSEIIITSNQQKNFEKKITEFFKEKLPDIAESLRSRINDNFQTFAAAK